MDDSVGDETEEPVDDATDPADPGATVDVAVAESPLGDHLVAADGMTIYLFTADAAPGDVEGQGGQRCLVRRRPRRVGDRGWTR